MTATRHFFCVNSLMTDESDLCSEYMVAHGTYVCSCYQRVWYMKEMMFPLLMVLLTSRSVSNYVVPLRVWIEARHDLLFLATISQFAVFTLDFFTVIFNAVRALFLLTALISVSFYKFTIEASFLVFKPHLYGLHLSGMVSEWVEHETPIFVGRGIRAS